MESTFRTFKGTVEDVFIIIMCSRSLTLVQCTCVCIVYEEYVQMYCVDMYNYSTVAPAIKYCFHVLPIIEVSRYNW